MNAFDINGNPINVNIIGEREIFMDGEKFNGAWMELHYKDANNLEKAKDYLYDLPTFKDGYIEAKCGRFVARAAAEIQKDAE